MSNSTDNYDPMFLASVVLSNDTDNSDLMCSANQYSFLRCLILLPKFSFLQPKEFSGWIFFLGDILSL